MGRRQSVALALGAVDKVQQAARASVRAPALHHRSPTSYQIY
jgi:hypothetical protein